MKLALLFLPLAFLAGACTSSDASGTDQGPVLLVSVNFEGSSLPPEFHESSAISVDGSTLRAIRWREYGDVVESDVTVELTAQQVTELTGVVRRAKLSSTTKVSEACSGISVYRVSVTWNSGTTVSGYQDGRTYTDGPGGRCEDHNLSGDAASVGSYLWDLASQESAS